MILSLYEAAIRNIGGGLGRKLRYWFYRRRLGACGKNLVIDTNVIISNPRHVFIGNNVWIDHHVMIMAGPAKSGRPGHQKNNPAYQFARGELHIGNDVHIASFVMLQAHGGMSIGNSLTIGAGSKLYSLSHHYRDVENKENLSQYLFGSMVPDSKQYLVESAVVVGNEAAVGLNCILLPGAVIPPETWIGVGMIIGSEKLESNAVYKVKQEWTYKTKGPGGA